MRFHYVCSWEISNQTMIKILILDTRRRRQKKRMEFICHVLDITQCTRFDALHILNVNMEPKSSIMQAHSYAPLKLSNFTNTIWLESVVPNQKH